MQLTDRREQLLKTARPFVYENAALTGEQCRLVAGSLDCRHHDVEHVAFAGHLHLDGTSLAADVRFELRIVQHDSGTRIIREPFCEYIHVRNPERIVLRAIAYDENICRH